MEAIRTIKDFKDFINANYSNIYSHVIKAEELTLEDEWMKEDDWEVVYQQEEKRNGEV